MMELLIEKFDKVELSIDRVFSAEDIAYFAKVEREMKQVIDNLDRYENLFIEQSKLDIDPNNKFHLERRGDGSFYSSTYTGDRSYSWHYSVMFSADVAREKVYELRVDAYERLFNEVSEYFSNQYSLEINKEQFKKKILKLSLTIKDLKEGIACYLKGSDVLTHAVENLKYEIFAKREVSAIRTGAKLTFEKLYFKNDLSDLCKVFSYFDKGNFSKAESIKTRIGDWEIDLQKISKVRAYQNCRLDVRFIDVDTCEDFIRQWGIKV